MHPNNTMKLYRGAVGMTIKQSITRHRLDAAQSMLIATRSTSVFAASPAEFRKSLARRAG